MSSSSATIFTKLSACHNPRAFCWVFVQVPNVTFTSKLLRLSGHGFNLNLSSFLPTQSSCLCFIMSPAHPWSDLLSPGLSLTSYHSTLHLGTPWTYLWLLAPSLSSCYSRSSLNVCMSDLLSPALSLTCCHSIVPLEPIYGPLPKVFPAVIDLPSTYACLTCCHLPWVWLVVTQLYIWAPLEPIYGPLPQVFPAVINVRGQTWTIFSFRHLHCVCIGIQISSTFLMDSQLWL